MGDALLSNRIISTLWAYLHLYHKYYYLMPEDTMPFDYDFSIAV